MKTAGWVIAALLMGMVLGSWGLKDDLRTARKQIADLQEQVRRGVKKQTRFDGIATMLNISQTQAPQPVAAGRGEVRVGFHGEVRTNSPDMGPPHGPWRPRRGQGTNELGRPRSMREGIEQATALWKVRSDLARNSFVSEATSNESQVAHFDVLMVAMNMRLSNSIRTWVDYLKTEQEMTPESGVRMMNELSTPIVQAYADLDRDLPDWRVKTDGQFNALDFVDPQLALPLTEVEDIVSSQSWDRAESYTNSL